MTLNEQQQHAVDSNAPNILCIAGAGTGKTRTLTNRIQRLIADGIQPKDIVAITFTKKAATEMKQRVSYPGIFIDTFHAWCLSLLRTYGHLLGWNGEVLQVIDEEDQKKITDGIKKNLGLRKSKNCASNAAQLALLLGEYRSFCMSQDIIDYDMLQTETLKLLQEHDTGILIDHLLVDEFQDTDPVQYAILCEIITRNIFIVGDDAQSIYSFRNACPENIRKFQHDFNPEIIVIEQNYRSGQHILEYANRIPVNAFKKALWSDIPGGYGVVVDDCHFETLEDEVLFFKGCLAWKNTPLTGTTAIIARTNAYLDEYAFYLEKAGIPFRRSRSEKWTPQERIAIANMKSMISNNELWTIGYDVNVSIGHTGRKIIEVDTAPPTGSKLETLDNQYREICGMLGEAYSIQGFLDFIETQRNEEVEVDPKEVNLLTIHAAKGLEFDNVFLVGCGKGIFPLQAEQEGEPYKEALRLFYVACTRAKANLFISWPSKYWSWGKELEITESGFVPGKGEEI